MDTLTKQTPGSAMKLAEAARILREAAQGDTPPLRVLLACGFEPLHLRAFLAAEMQQRLLSYKVQVEVGSYDDCLGTISTASADGIDAVFVALEWADLDPRLGIRRTPKWCKEVQGDIIRSVDQRIAHFAQAMENRARANPLTVCLPTLPLLPMTHFPTWQASAFELDLRNRLAGFAARVGADPRIRVVHPGALDQLSPAGERIDVRSETLFGFPYTLPHASMIARLFCRTMYPPPSRRGLITDLDDTLWRGILGEVGSEGVSWHLDCHSHMHGVYQQLLWSLANTGVLIGIASKNDPALAQEALARPDLILTQDLVFPVEAHWEPKSVSVARILEAWNLGAESVVFVDDSPAEIAEVERSHPGIECLLFPRGDDGAICRLIERLRDLFGKPEVSKEDRIRSQSVRRTANLNRPGNGTAAEEFLQESRARLSVRLDAGPSDSRALELVNKTNQFNLNGRRYVRSEWESVIREAGAFLLVVDYEDRYGPLGKVAVITGHRNGGTLQIRSWAMSCRAFARRIEDRCLELLFTRLGVEEIELDYRTTERNGPMHAFLARYAPAAEGTPVIISRQAFWRLCPPLYHEVEVLSNG